MILSRLLLLYLTYELVQVFVTSDKTDVSLFKACVCYFLKT